MINGHDFTKEHDIPVGEGPSAIGYDQIYDKIFVANQLSNTVSVIDGDNHTNDIAVGIEPQAIAADVITHLIYVANYHSNTVSVIHVSVKDVSQQPHFSYKVAAGTIFNVNPANSGKIICNNPAPGSIYPTNIYLYVDAGTNCTAQPNKDFDFNTWVANLSTNRNSSIPLQSTGNLTVNRYGEFTVNFKPHPPQVTIPEAFLYGVVLGPTVGAIAGGFFAWYIPNRMGLRKARIQRKYFKECIDEIGKLDKNAIEDKIIGYYADGKISGDHHQLLTDKISDYYKEEKSSE